MSTQAYSTKPCPRCRKIFPVVDGQVVAHGICPRKHPPPPSDDEIGRRNAQHKVARAAYDADIRDLMNDPLPKDIVMKTCSACPRKFHERALDRDLIPRHNVIAASKVTHNDPAKQCPGTGLPPRETGAARATIAAAATVKADDAAAALAAATAVVVPPAGAPAPIEVETPAAPEPVATATGSGKVPAPS